MKGEKDGVQSTSRRGYEKLFTHGDSWDSLGGESCDDELPWLATLYRMKFPPPENFFANIPCSSPFNMSFRGRGSATGANRGGFGNRGGE